jgi:putative PIN family toxin of toxin-antitoxin system
VRVVVDSNVLVSALIFPGGNPEVVYRLAIEGRLELVTSRPLLAELGSVLQDKFGWDPGRVEQAIGQLARIATLTEPADVIDEISADPADNRVLEAAAAGAVEVIVSGDRHLLALGRWRDIPIRAPADFLASL